MTTSATSDTLARPALPVGPQEHAALPSGLRDLLTRRAAQAADFQDGRHAGRFLDLVERAAARDDDAHGWALTRAVAESWFKLLTYKDEYERLIDEVSAVSVPREA